VSTTALKITETVSPPAVGALRRGAARAIADAGVDEAIVAGIQLCLSEALTNATMHGYSGRSGDVEISVEIDAEEVIVTVRDEGHGFGGGPNDAGEGGGLGLGLIGSVADALRVTSETGRGTEIRMAFSRDVETSSAARLMSP